MALLLTLLLVLGVVSPAVAQFSMFGGTTTIDCVVGGYTSDTYTSTDMSCCGSFIITNMLRLCCTSGGQCICSPNLGISCPAATITTTAQPVTTSTASTPTTPTTPATTSTPLPAAPPVTTTPSPKLCPAAFTGRVMNAPALSTATVCPGKGAIGLSTASGQVCNGAYEKDILGNTLIYTLSSCWQQQLTTALVGSTSMPIDSCAVKEAVVNPIFPELTTLILTPLAAFFMENTLESCSDDECVYNPFTMSSAIVWNTCQIISYGATTTGFAGGALNSVPVVLSDVTQCMNAPTTTLTQCFISSGPYPCSTDNGAPLYCELTSGETVLYGLTSVDACSAGASASFNVVPLYMANPALLTPVDLP